MRSCKKKLKITGELVSFMVYKSYKPEYLSDLFEAISVSNLIRLKLNGESTSDNITELERKLEAFTNKYRKIIKNLDNLF